MLVLAYRSANRKLAALAPACEATLRRDPAPGLSTMKLGQRVPSQSLCGVASLSLPGHLPKGRSHFGASVFAAALLASCSPPSGQPSPSAGESTGAQSSGTNSSDAPIRPAPDLEAKPTQAPTRADLVAEERLMQKECDRTKEDRDCSPLAEREDEIADLKE